VRIWAQGPGTRSRAALQQHQGLQQARFARPASGLRGQHVELSPHGDGLRSPPRYASARAGETSPAILMAGTLPPKKVGTGPVKENIVTGKGCRSVRISGLRIGIARMAGDISRPTRAASPKIPDTNVMNVGVYRGMIGDKNHIPIYMYRAQHIGPSRASPGSKKAPRRCRLPLSSVGNRRWISVPVRRFRWVSANMM